MAGNSTKFLLAVGELARTAVATFTDFIPVTTHLGLVESIRLFVKVAGRKTDRNIIDWPRWNNRDEGAVMTMTGIQKRIATSPIVLVHVTTTHLNVLTSLVVLVDITAASLNALTNLDVCLH